MSNQAQCSHSKVNRVTTDYPGRFTSEKWTCPDCGTNFWPEGTDMHIRKRRDNFAAAALTGLISQTDRSMPVKIFAEEAFKCADAMLVESDKSK